MKLRIRRAVRTMNLTRTILLLCALFCALPAGAQTPPVAPPATAPAPKPLLVLRPSGSLSQLVRALSTSTEGNAIFAVLPDGRRGAWEKNTYIETLPWYTDAELRSGAVDLEALAGRYGKVARARPGIRAELEADIAKFRALAAERKTERQENVAVALAPYEPGKAYSDAVLRQAIREGETALAAAPGRAAEIASTLAPFREHLAHLEAGDLFLNGEWQNAAEAAEREAAEKRAEAERQFEAGLSIPLRREVLPAGRVQPALWLGGGLLSVPVLLGMVLIVRRKRLAGGLLILLPLAAGGGYLFLAADTTVPAPMPPAADETGAAVTRLLFGGAPPEQGAALISAADVNAFLAAKIVMQGEPAEDTVVREGPVEVRFRSGGVVLYEMVKWRGRERRLSYDVDLSVRNGEPWAGLAGVAVGRAPLPPPWSDWLWQSLAAELETFLSAHLPLRHYEVNEFSESGVSLTSTAPAAAAPTPDPTPSPLPEETPMSEPEAIPTPEATPSPAAAAAPETITPEEE